MSNTDAKTSLSAIRLVAFDVDGVFTDGRFYLSNDGVESKSFNTQDGYGIRRLLEAGIEVAVISGRSSAAVEQRMAELGFATSYRAARTRSPPSTKLSSALDISAAECAYVGDDIPDLPLLRKVGYAIAVANAVKAVREHCRLHNHCGWRSRCRARSL